MTPALYAYPDDPRPAVNAFAAKYKARYGFDVNFLGETGYTAAQFVLAVLDKAGRDLTLDSFINALESMRDYHDIFGSPPLTLTPTNHHAANQSFLTVVHNIGGFLHPLRLGREDFREILVLHHPAHRFAVSSSTV